MGFPIDLGAFDQLAAHTGIAVVDGDKLYVRKVSAKSGSDNGLREITIGELMVALQRTLNYTADGAITLANGTAKLSKTSAAAMTLAAPTAAQEGLEILLTCGTAFAHVVTATGLIQDGVTGGSKDTVTLGAFVGASATLRAINLKWHLVSKTVATIA